LGDRENNLRKAINKINREMRVTAISSVYETEPMYYEEQGWFLNCAIALETDIRPKEVLKRLRVIEEKLGRKPGPRYGPRVIDLDLLFYDDLVLSEPDLEIPHPRLAERAFVLAPLNEIRPDMVHPVLRKKVSELLGEVGSGKKVVRKPGPLDDFAPSVSPRRS